MSVRPTTHDQDVPSRFVGAGFGVDELPYELPPRALREPKRFPHLHVLHWLWVALNYAGAALLVLWQSPFRWEREMPGLDVAQDGALCQLRSAQEGLHVFTVLVAHSTDGASQAMRGMHRAKMRKAHIT
jgi:hypothetical protein